MDFRLPSTSSCFFGARDGPLAGRLLLCMLLVCILFVGVPITIAILMAAVSPTPAPDALGLPL